MLGRSRRRRPNIKTTLDRRLVLAGDVAVVHLYAPEQSWQHMRVLFVTPTFC